MYGLFCDVLPLQEPSLIGQLNHHVTRYMYIFGGITGVVLFVNEVLGYSCTWSHVAFSVPILIIVFCSLHTCMLEHIDFTRRTPGRCYHSQQFMCFRLSPTSLDVLVLAMVCSSEGGRSLAIL